MWGGEVHTMFTQCEHNTLKGHYVVLKRKFKVII